MLQVLLYILLAIIVGGGLFLLAARFLPAGEQIAPPVRDESPWELPPSRSLVAEDIDTVRLPVALRGYRFAETDELLDRLATELRERDAEIDRLRNTSPPEVVRPQDGLDLAAGGQVGDTESSCPPPDASTPDEGRTSQEDG